MPARSKRIQVISDNNVHRILTEMGKAGLRGKSTSEVAYTILDEWLWHNQDKLKSSGISFSAKKK